MRPVPRLLPVLLVLFALLAFAAPVRGDEGQPAPPVADGPDPKPPFWSVEFLLPEAENAPEGWKVVDAAPPAGAPAAAAITALGEGLGLGLDAFYAEGAVVERGDARAGLVLVDVDRKVHAFRGALDAKAAEASWTVRELGTPTRLLVVGGPAAAAAAEPLVDFAVYQLADKAVARVDGRGGTQAANREAAGNYAASIRAIEGESAMAHVVEGIVHWVAARQGKELDKALEAKATEAFARAIEPGRPQPPRGRRLVFVAGKLGGALLETKDASRLDEAVAALETAVKHEAEGRRNEDRYGNRYNLTCAYARKGDRDAAFKMLEKSLETGKTLPPADWRVHYEHMKEKDPDMAALREDPRFAELMEMEKYKPEPLPPGHGQTGKPDPEKDRRGD